MKQVLLQRITTSDEGTFGELTVDDKKWFTGELPWHDNQPSVSCIPSGTYLVEMDPSPRFKRDLYELRKVPNREAILIHPANFMGDEKKGFKSQLNGCIAVGLRLGALDGQRALLLSRDAVTEFEEHMERLPFELEIRDIKDGSSAD